MRRRYGYVVALTSDGTPTQQNGGGVRRMAIVLAAVQRGKGNEISVYRSDLNTPHQRDWKFCPKL